LLALRCWRWHKISIEVHFAHAVIVLPRLVNSLGTYIVGSGGNDKFQMSVGASYQGRRVVPEILQLKSSPF